MKRTLVIALVLAAAGAHASTLAEYRGKCRLYVEHRFKFEGMCTIGVGVTSADAKTAELVYRVTPPEGGDLIDVRLYPKRTATIDGVPAKEVSVLPAWFHFEGANGADLRFTKPPKDLRM